MRTRTLVSGALEAGTTLYPHHLIQCPMVMNITFLRTLILLVHEISEPTNLHKENPPAGLFIENLVCGLGKSGGFVRVQYGGASRAPDTIWPRDCIQMYSRL